MAVRHNAPNKWNISNGYSSFGGLKKSSEKSKSIANLSIEKLRESSQAERHRRFSGGNLTSQALKNKSYSPRECSPLSRDCSPVDRARRVSGGNITSQALKNKSYSTRTLSSGNLAIVALKRQAYAQRSSSNISLDLIDDVQTHPGRKLSEGSHVATDIRNMSNSDWRNSTGNISLRSRSSSTRRSSSVAKDEHRESSPATRISSTDLTSSPKRERTRKKGVIHNSDFIVESNNTNSLTIASDIVKSIVLSQDIAPLRDNDLLKGGIKESPITRITEMVVFTFAKLVCIVFVIMMFDDNDS